MADQGWRDVHESRKDVIGIVRTGMDKIPTFWMPILFRPVGIRVAVTPLNLGKQNVASLVAVGMPFQSTGNSQIRHLVLLGFIP